MERNMVLVIDIDSKRRPQIHITRANRVGDSLSADEDEKPDPVRDMAFLCEALCTVIHAAEGAKIKDSASSLRDCINHLEQGFADPTYFATISIDGE